MSNTFGKLYKITTFGESHGAGVGVVIDGCPPGFEIDLNHVQNELNRRRPGQSELTSPRKEGDQVECFSGMEKNRTLGTPICLMVRNKNTRPEDYTDVAKVFRPSHADYTTYLKYGVSASSGGGRASARETIGRVAAAAIAKQIIKQMYPDFEVMAYVNSIKDIETPLLDANLLRNQLIEQSPVRCPDPDTAQKMIQLIKETKALGDSLGGCIKCLCLHVPAGLGEPVFDKLEAQLAMAMLSIPACKGFEIGSGFSGTRLLGSEHNDPYFIGKNGEIRTSKNDSGGIQGGISNGEHIEMKIAFKPTSTIFKPQKTVSQSGENVLFAPENGRHDPCVLPRAVPVVEAMATLTIMDFILRQKVIMACKKN